MWITCDYLWLFMVVNEPTSDSEFYLHLYDVDISIWTACDVYCELCVMPVMFIWLAYVIRDRTIKQEIYGRFAECYTRQRDCLPSACVKTLDKVDTWQNSMLSRTEMVALPSVWAVTLGKEANNLPYQPVFAECVVFDTRQSINVCQVPWVQHTAKVELLPWHGFVTRQMGEGCRVSRILHTAKCEMLPSAWDSTHDKPAVTVPSPSHYFFRRVPVLALGKMICRVPDRKYSAKSRLWSL
jgi:hypothetical protein